MQDLQRKLHEVQHRVKGLVILSTSRNWVLLHEMDYQAIHLQPLKPKDAQELLKVFRPDLSDAMATQLADLCGSIPIALRIVGKTIGKGGLSAEVWRSNQIPLWHLNSISAGSLCNCTCAVSWHTLSSEV